MQHKLHHLWLSYSPGFHRSTASHRIFLLWHLSGLSHCFAESKLQIIAAQIWTTWCMIPIFPCRCQSRVCANDECVQRSERKSSPGWSGVGEQATVPDCRFYQGRGCDWLRGQKLLCADFFFFFTAWEIVFLTTYINFVFSWPPHGLGYYVWNAWSPAQKLMCN